MFGDGLIQQSNPDLKPEKSHNVNLGLIFDKIWGVHHLYAETDLIYRHTSDFILKGVSVTANPTSSYKNIGNVLTRGLEASVKYNYKSLLHAGINFTYQNIIDNQRYEDNTDSYVNNGGIEHITYKQKLPNIPYLFTNGNLGLGFNNIFHKDTRLTLDYYLNCVHEYYLAFPGLGDKSSKDIIPEQFSHDISLGYTMGNGRYSIMLECTNLTNRKLYDNNTDAQTAGNYYVSLCITANDVTTYYVVSAKDLRSGTISAKNNGVEQTGYRDFVQNGRTIYSIGGLGLTDCNGRVYL